jgi:hypothetical protein
VSSAKVSTSSMVATCHAAPGCASTNGFRVRLYPI